MINRREFISGLAAALSAVVAFRKKKEPRQSITMDSAYGIEDQHGRVWVSSVEYRYAPPGQYFYIDRGAYKRMMLKAHP